MLGETELKVYTLGPLSSIPLYLIWGLMVVFVIGCVILVMRKGWKGGLRATAFLLLIELLFLIICTAIIFREERVERTFNLIPFDSYYHYPENSYFIEAAAVNILNVIMFIPLGLLLGCGFREMTWKKVLLIGFGISFSIELLQVFLKRGICETDDLIHNLLGCLIGFGIYKLFISLIKYVQTFFQKIL